MRKLAFGIDIGGINTAFGLVDESGEIVAESKISTAAHPYFEDYAPYVELLCAEMKRLFDSVAADSVLAGIGVGAPNANFYTGTIDTPANLWKFKGNEPSQEESLRVFPLAADLAKHFADVPIYVTNDANAATIGEMVYGNARSMRDFVMITLGTGVGSGFVANGEMIYGHDGFAGEAGHIIIERGGRECGCGRRGCLETYCSAIGVKRTAFEVMASCNAPSELRNIPFAELDSARVAQEAAKGDVIALETFRLTGMRLGRALADMVTITSPKAIFIFGGLAKAGDLLFDHVRHYMEEDMLFAFKNKVEVLPSALQDKNAAILGASALVWKGQQ